MEVCLLSFTAIFGVPEDLCVRQYALAVIQYSKESLSKLHHITEIHFVDINERMVTCIQDMFTRAFTNFEDVSPNFSDYMTRSPGHVRTKKSKASVNNLKVELEKTGEHAFKVRGEQTQLFVLHGDITQCKAETVVVVIDENGKGGRLLTAVQDKMIQNKMNFYKKECSIKRDKKRVGDVFSTGGCGSPFEQIHHVILPLSIRQNTRRQSIVGSAFQRVFEGTSVSVATALLGIGMIL